MTPLISRVLAVSLAILAIFAIIAGGILPLIDSFSEADRRITTLEEQLARFAERRQTPSAQPGITVVDRVFLEGSSEAIASAALQDLVESAVLETGGRMDSLRSDAAVPFEEGVQLPITAEFSTDAAGLQQLLWRLETGQPYLILNSLTARRETRQSVDEGDQIGIRLTLFGFYRGG